MEARKPLTIKQLRQYPPEVLKLDEPEVTSEGFASVAKDRDGPLKLHYKIYGHGPVHIVWIGGHGAGLEDWYNIVRYFGFQNSDKYTSLIFENRGIGRSESSWSMWSMRALAQDIKDLLDHVGWTENKSVHVVGHSMGGMIAMELAIAHTSIVKTLFLLSTSSNWFKDWSFSSGLKFSSNMALALSADSRLTATKTQMLGQQWLTAPDENGTFPTNGDAWAAKFIGYQLYPRGAILQAPAIVRHRVKPGELKRVAREIGPGKVIVVHGTGDKMLPVATADRTWIECGGKETSVGIRLFDGVGHLPHVEKLEEIVRLVESFVCRDQEGLGETDGTGNTTENEDRNHRADFSQEGLSLQASQETNEGKSDTASS